MTTPAVMEGTPPTDLATSMAMGVVTDFGAKDLINISGALKANNIKIKLSILLTPPTNTEIQKGIRLDLISSNFS